MFYYQTYAERSRSRNIIFAEICVYTFHGTSAKMILGLLAELLRGVVFKHLTREKACCGWLATNEINITLY